MDTSKVAAFFDIKMFGDNLPNNSRFKKIKGLIRQLASAGSALGDLSMAKDHMNIVQSISGPMPYGTLKGKYRETNEIIGGLVNTAIILYCRATHTTSKKRSTDPILDKLEGEDRRWHKIITELRDDGIAHFGYGPDTADPWSKDAVVLKAVSRSDMMGCELTMYYPPIRVSYRAEVNDALTSLIEKAYKIIHSYLISREEGFFNEFDIISSDDDVLELLHSVPFDYRAFWTEFGDPEERLSSMLDDDYGGSPTQSVRTPPKPVFGGWKAQGN